MCFPAPKKILLDENPDPLETQSVSGSARSVATSKKSEGPASAKKQAKPLGRGALHPNYWINKCDVWDALSGPVDGRNHTQATFCVEREKRNTKNQEAAKELHKHVLAYLLAVDLCQAESQYEEESLVALTGLWKYNKQQAIPCSLCIGILQKKLKAFIESFRLSATMDMCKAYCQMLCPFVQKQDDKNNEFFRSRASHVCGGEDLASQEGRFLGCQLCSGAGYHDDREALRVPASAYIS